MIKARRTIWFILSKSLFVLTYPLILYAIYLDHAKKYTARDKYAHCILAFIARSMFYLTGSKIMMIGLKNIPKDKPVIFVSNHQGHMDSVIIQGFIKKSKGFISIKEFENYPILGSWMTYTGSVFIDRGNMQQTLITINKAIDNLKRGQTMVVYPEGKLNKGAPTAPFERGWIRLVRKSDVPIVPITIKGSYKVVSYDGKMVKSANVECVISKPIDCSKLKKADEVEFLKDLRDIIISKL